MTDTPLPSWRSGAVPIQADFLRRRVVMAAGLPAYAPMRELLRHLAAHGFVTYIVSGGGPERVIGTTAALEYRVENGIGNVYHTPKLELFDDGPANVVRISQISKERGWTTISVRDDWKAVFVK